MIWSQYDINMPKLFKLFFANYYLHTAENFYTLFYLNALYAKFFFMEKTQLPKTTKQTIKTNVWSVIKWGEKNELFRLKLTFSQNNLANFYFSSSKQILISATTWKRQRYTSFLVQHRIFWFIFKHSRSIGGKGNMHMRYKLLLSIFIRTPYTDRNTSI